MLKLLWFFKFTTYSIKYVNKKYTMYYYILVTFSCRHLLDYNYPHCFFVPLLFRAFLKCGNFVICVTAMIYSPGLISQYPTVTPGREAWGFLPLAKGGATD